MYKHYRLCYFVSTRGTVYSVWRVISLLMHTTCFVSTRGTVYSVWRVISLLMHTTCFVSTRGTVYSVWRVISLLMHTTCFVSTRGTVYSVWRVISLLMHTTCFGAAWVNTYETKPSVWMYPKWSVSDKTKNIILIGWQAYRGDQIHRKNSPTEPWSQIQVKYKNAC